MRKIQYSILSLFFIVASQAHNENHHLHSSYNDAFIFVEQGIEFAVFRDGQFDFNLPRHRPSFAYSNFYGETLISYNSGYDYSPFLQYDHYGAIIQIEHIPIYYDYYGRIRRAGNVHIRYNSFGHVVQVGGLHIRYNGYHRPYFRGYINSHNRYYTYQPWHSQYRRPKAGFCVIYNKPYRRHYNPNRRHYFKSFKSNHRPKVTRHRGTRIVDRHIRSKPRSETVRRKTTTTTPKQHLEKTTPRRSSKVNNQAYSINSIGRSEVAVQHPRKSSRSSKQQRIRQRK